MQRSGCISYRGRLNETAPPSLIYLGEFLMVLSLRCNKAKGPAEYIWLVLWPDSLMPPEDRRLRRYLRFDLGQDLTDV